jgi:hypothetical protein
LQSVMLHSVTLLPHHLYPSSSLSLCLGACLFLSVCVHIVFVFQ